MLTFYEFPAEHWRHLRTTNIIESPFAPVRLRTRVTKGAGSRTKALMMAFKLLAMAEERWRKVNGSELLPLVESMQNRGCYLSSVMSPDGELQWASHG